MRPSIVIAAVAVAAFAAGAGYYGLEVYPQQQFRAGLDQTIANLPPGTTATFKDAHYSVLSHLATVTGVTVHTAVPGDQPRQIDITIESVESTNPNLDFSNAWTRAKLNPTAFTPDTSLPISDSVLVKGVTLHSDLIDTSQDLVRVDKPRLYPWALLHDGLPTWPEFVAALTPKSQPPDPAAILAVLRAESAWMLGIAYDNYGVDVMKIAVKGPEIQFAYNVRKASGGVFDRGIINGGTIEGVTVTGNKVGAFSMDRATMGAIDLREPMTRIVNGEILSAALLNGIRVGRIEYTGITVQPPGQAPFHGGGFSIGPMAFDQGMPVSAEFGWKDFSISRAQITDPKGQDAFDKLGLQSMNTSFAMAYDWDLAKKHLAVHDTTLKIDELGTLTLSADLTNVAPGALGAVGARLAHGLVRFVDASLTDRMLHLAAAQTGADPAAFRKQMEDLVAKQSVAYGPAMVAPGNAVSDFIASPKSLTIELAPPAPVPVMALQGAAKAPAALVTLLGLNVKANQP
jgi:hypothetical protein